MAENPAQLAVLSIDEAATYLRASRGHIYNLMHRGELNSVRAGHRRLIRRVDLDEMLERGSGNMQPRLPGVRPASVRTADIFA